MGVIDAGADEVEDGGGGVGVDGDDLVQEQLAGGVVGGADAVLEEGCQYCQTQT